jgi:hypothetical protein
MRQARMATGAGGGAAGGITAPHLEWEGEGSPRWQSYSGALHRRYRRKDWPVRTRRPAGRGGWGKAPDNAKDWLARRGRSSHSPTMFVVVKPRPRRSGPSSRKRASCRLRSRCDACSPASPTTRRRGSMPGLSPGGGRWLLRCRSGLEKGFGIIKRPESNFRFRCYSTP